MTADRRETGAPPDPDALVDPLFPERSPRAVAGSASFSESAHREALARAESNLACAMEEMDSIKRERDEARAEVAEARRIAATTGDRLASAEALSTPERTIAAWRAHATRGSYTRRSA